MSKFDKHFCMNNIDAIEYIQEKLPHYFDNAVLTCTEIGDGNINYVYRIEDTVSKKSIIIKQADIYFRDSTDPVDVDRNRIEAKILQIQNQLAKNLVPNIYLYDPIMSCIVMEDIKGHENLRYCLLERKTFNNFVEDITTFLAETLIKTTDLVISPSLKKNWDKEFINPDMCSITERLVLEEPYKNKRNSNQVLPINLEFVKKEIYDDKKLCLEASKLKYIFQSKSQSLLHGDLHSGSIFIKEGSIKILDPEFAFYGPSGYDVGNVIAHLIFAYANAMVCNDNIKEYQQWILESISSIIDIFRIKALNILKNNTSDIMYNSEEFREYYILDILKDTAGFTGTELIRRTVGSSKVKDLTNISDQNSRAIAERLCVLVGKELILNRDKIIKGIDYINVITSKVGNSYER